MKIYAIRHGLTELNKKGIFNGHIDEELSPEGIEQAKIAIPLIPKEIKKIYSSSQKRAKQTAEIINSELKVPISFHDELGELSMGTLDGQDFTEERKIKHKSLQYDWSPYGGESVEDVKKRILKILNEIRLATIKNDGEVLVVTSGGIIRLLHFLETGTLLDSIGNMSVLTFDLDKIIDGSSI